MNRKISYTNSQVRVKVYHYTDDTTTNVNVLELDDILSMQISKDINSPSGTFSLNATSSKNWKKLISPGDWLLIFLKNDGEERLRLIGNVDRVSRVQEVNEEGIMTVRYGIFGRDFGKVFEKTNIYYNPYSAITSALDVIFLKEGMLVTGSPNELIIKLIDIFLGPGVESISQLNQWFISDKLKGDILGSQNVGNAKKGTNTVPGGPSFFDILDFSKIDKTTKGFKAYESISALQGFLFNFLKENSNQAMNELFLELNFDPKTGISKPAVFHRMIPFTEEQFPFDPIAGNVIKFVDLDRVKITDETILVSDVGEADHNKFNFTLLTSAGTPFFDQDYIANLQPAGDIPKIDEDSIRRNGLLLRLDRTDFGFLSGATKGENDFQILIAWNHLLAHWWENAHKLESGTMRILYNKDVYIGKVLEVRYTDLNETYLYYIEGYSISWTYPGTLLMDLSLTRGRKLDFNKRFIEDSNDENKKYTGQNKVLR